MRIEYVELSGFRGFKDKSRFEFPAGFVVLTGRNGAGKSTVLDAIDFALTGTIDKFAVTAAKKGGLDSHIWWLGDGVAQSQYVEVGFLGTTGERFAITRSRDRGLTPSLEGIGPALCIGHFTGDWARTLIQTTLIRDETLAGLSMDLPEQARFEAVRAAIGGLTGPDHSDRTSDIMSAAKIASAEQESKLVQVQAELGRALTTLTEARSIANRQTDVSEAEMIIRSLEPDVGAISAELSERLRRRIAERKLSIQVLEEAIERAEKVSSEQIYFASEAGISALTLSEQKVAALTSTYEQALRELSVAEALANAEGEADTYATHMVAILSHGEELGLVEGHCPLCYAARTNSEFASAIAAARARLSARGEAAIQSAARLQAVRQKNLLAESDLEEAKREQAELTHRKEQLAVQLDEVKAVFARLALDVSPAHPEAARQSMLKRQEETAEIERALFILEASGAHDRVSALETRIEQLRVMIEAETLKTTASERALEAAKKIDHSARTVANQVLAEQFDTVMPLLKELYLRLRPHTDWREIETDFGGKIRASLNFTVGEGRNPQFLFSSGERRAAGLAFLLAIHLSRPWTKLRSLLLDDPVQHIDDYRALNLVEVLSAVRRLGRQVVVAVEDPALADLLCRRLRSNPDETGRRFDLTTSANGSASIGNQTEILPLPREILELSKVS